MPEAVAASASRTRMPMLAALGAGAAFTSLAALGGPLAAIGVILAQPAFAVAVAQWRGRQAPPRAWLREAGWVAALWSAALVASVVLVAWPLALLLRDGSLAAALGLSLVAGLLLIAGWRAWPLWRGLEGDGGTLPQHWRALPGLVAGDWR